MLTEFKVRSCGSDNPVGVLRQSYGLGVYGPGLKEGDVVAACECCPEVRYLSATLGWVGYERFVCEGDDPIDYSDRDRTKYLIYTTSGEAQISDCSGTANYQTTDATQGWTIDPFTGLTNYSGPGTQNVSYLCSSGTSTCSPTQKQKTCTIYGDDPCTDAEETERTVTFTETLSWDYGLDDVADKVDEAVGRLDLYSETQGIPDGTVGFLENGTGHSIVRLSPAQNAYASCPAGGCPGQLNALWVETFNPTTRQWFVTKQYIYIKFKDRTEYKVYRKDLTTGEIKESEETDSGEKVIKANKLNEEVWVSVSSGNQFFLCGDGYKCFCSTMAGCEDTGKKIYKQSPEACTPLVGPDCQQYVSAMLTELRQGDYSETLLATLNGPIVDGGNSMNYELTRSILTTACPSSSLESTKETETQYGYGLEGSTKVFYSNTRTRTVSDNVETFSGDTSPPLGWLIPGDGSAACACQKNITTEVYDSNGFNLTPDTTVIGAETKTCITVINGAEITTTSTYVLGTSVSASATFSSGEYNESEVVDATSSGTQTSVWSNANSEDGLETVSDEINYTNSAWYETGFDSSLRFYVSKADVKKKCVVKFTACQTNQSVAPFDQAIDYEVLLHCAKRTFNQKDPDNPILTWEVDNQLKTVRSKGGPETKSFSIDIPTPETDKTVAALAYSTCTVWKKPN